MVCHGTIRYGMCIVWYDMVVRVWYGVCTVWHGMIWQWCCVEYCMVYCTVWHSITSITIFHGMAWHSIVWESII